MLTAYNVRFSDDQGVSWSAPTLVAGGGDGLMQFWPVVSSDANGRVNVTWNQSVETVTPDFIDLDGLGTSLVDVFWSESLDGGTSFSVSRPIRRRVGPDRGRAAVSRAGGVSNLDAVSSQVVWASGQAERGDGALDGSADFYPRSPQGPHLEQWGISKVFRFLITNVRP